jgi:hypothetical protein
MKKKTTLDETQMREMIAESVEQVLEARKKHMLTEMAFPMGIYKQKIDNIFPQILTHWCLVHYCTITCDPLSKEQWKEELRGHLATTAKYSIKRNDAPDKRLKVFHEVWEENDFSLPNTINLTVYNKFFEEGIDVRSDDYATTLIDCISSAQGIFDAILSRNTDTIRQYVETV